MSTTENKEKSPGEQYAEECIKKLLAMAASVPTGTLANNVRTEMESCIRSIRFEVKYCRQRGIT